MNHHCNYTNTKNLMSPIQQGAFAVDWDNSLRIAEMCE